MAETKYEIVTIQSQRITVDQLVWKRYRRRTHGVVERTMEANPEIAKAHRFGPFLPVGMVVKIPILRRQLEGEPSRQRAVTLYGSEP